jgi:mannosyltransferase PIG-V
VTVLRQPTLRVAGVQLAGWQEILAALLATRAALTVVALFAVAIVHGPSRHLDLLPGFPWLEPWAQWDAEHYIAIAVDGYSFEPGTFSNVIFFPLYPWLIRLVAAPFGPLSEQGTALAGLLISNVALFIALLYLAALVTRDLSLSVARKTVLYLLVFPTTLFLSSVYAESLFLATAAAGLYHARQGEWYRAGLAGGLAALTRPFGFLLVVPIAIEMYRQRPPLRALPSIALVPAGLAVFFGYLWAQFGDPFLYFRAGQAWGRGFHFPWETLLGYIRGPLVMFDWPYAWIDLVAVVAMVAILVVGWRRVPLSYSAYAGAGLLFALSTGVAWFSASRHALALFPLIVMLAVFGDQSRAFNWVWLAVSIALAVGFMARVAVGYWVA